jgi:hypothetical protein
MDRGGDKAESKKIDFGKRIFVELVFESRRENRDCGYSLSIFLTSMILIADIKNDRD